MMKFLPGKRAVLVLLVVALWASVAGATILGNDGISTADFSLSGTTLTVTLTNNNPILGGETAAGQALTAVFWNYANDATNPLTKGTAVLGAGSSVIQTAITGNLASEFGYLANLNLTGTAFVGDNQGISNAGFSAPVSFGPGSLFLPNTDLNPVSPGAGGGDYAMVGPNYVAGNGGGKFGIEPLVQSQMVFTLTGFTGTLGDISNVQFNYGTALASVPIPPSVLLMGSGLLGLGLVGWRRRQKKA
jgi:hypothetical protein